MNRLVTSLLLIFISALHAQEEQQVLASYKSYKQAILNGQGSEAVKFVDSNTLNYYEGILKKAKVADSITVDKLPIMDKLMVLVVRERVEKEKILSFDTKSFFIHAVDQGMVGKDSVQNNEVGTVEVDGETAKGAMVIGGQTVPYHFEFNKEEGVWKLDLTAIFPMATTAFETMITQSGQQENDYLMLLLQMLTGKTPSNTIWKPLE